MSELEQIVEQLGARVAWLESVTDLQTMVTDRLARIEGLADRLQRVVSDVPA